MSAKDKYYAKSWSKIKKIMSKAKAYAVVVCYRPEIQVLINLTLQLSEQYDKVILSDNGGGVEINDYKIPNLIYICNGGNIGLGAALNKSLRYCELESADYVALFDQDSAIPNNHFFGLKHAHEQLICQNVKCIATAPLFYDRREKVKKYFPFYKKEKNKILKINPLPNSNHLVEVDLIITSGMLINMSLLEKQYFDEGLIVDYTDTEWCFRIAKTGCKLYGVPAVIMGHALSDSPAKRILGFWILKYSPVRRYYYTRNTIKLTKLDYVPSAYKIRLLVGSLIRLFTSIFSDEKKYSSLKSIVFGFKDGLLNKNGLIDSKTLDNINK